MIYLLKKASLKESLMALLVFSSPPLRKEELSGGMVLLLDNSGLRMVYDEDRFNFYFFRPPSLLANLLIGLVKGGGG